MNGADSVYLVDYFKDKEGKYLKLRNGKKVRLIEIIENQYRLELIFSYGSKVLTIPFSKLYEDAVTIDFPDGLEQGYYISSIVKFNNLQSIGYAVENILVNWTEREYEIIKLNWEEL